MPIRKAIRSIHRKPWPSGIWLRTLRPQIKKQDKVLLLFKKSEVVRIYRTLSVTLKRLFVIFRHKATLSMLPRSSIAVVIFYYIDTFFLYHLNLKDYFASKT